MRARENFRKEAQDANRSRDWGKQINMETRQRGKGVAHWDEKTRPKKYSNTIHGTLFSILKQSIVTIRWRQFAWGVNNAASPVLWLVLWILVAHSFSLPCLRFGLLFSLYTFLPPALPGLNVVCHYRSFHARALRHSTTFLDTPFWSVFAFFLFCSSWRSQAVNGQSAYMKRELWNVNCETE